MLLSFYIILMKVVNTIPHAKHPYRNKKNIHPVPRPVSSPHSISFCTVLYVRVHQYSFVHLYFSLPLSSLNLCLPRTVLDNQAKENTFSVFTNRPHTQFVTREELESKYRIVMLRQSVRTACIVFYRTYGIYATNALGSALIFSNIS